MYIKTIYKKKEEKKGNESEIWSRLNNKKHFRFIMIINKITMWLSIEIVQFISNVSLEGNFFHHSGELVNDSFMIDTAKISIYIYVRIAMKEFR